MSLLGRDNTLGCVLSAQGGGGRGGGGSFLPCDRHTAEPEPTGVSDAAIDRHIMDRKQTERSHY